MTMENLIGSQLTHEFGTVAAALLGACIGSFLNMLIHRLPHGVPVSNPKRSFCPECKSTIPWWCNLPVLSWLLLRGRCRECGKSIPLRYLVVEVFTALIFAVVWILFAPQSLAATAFLWLFLALLIAISWIDAEHMIIPTALTWLGSVCGLLGSALWPKMPSMAQDSSQLWHAGILHSAIGWAAGFGGLWLVVQLGKLAFGKKTLKFEQAEAWRLREARDDQDTLHFVMNDEEIAWWDLFSRKSDRLIIDCSQLRVDGKPSEPGHLVIREMQIELPDGSVRQIEELESLDGKANSVVIPREAMGTGDIHLLGMIGAHIGWLGVCFSLFAASLVALLAAIVGRIGLGRALPFGPFLAIGCLIWLLGGWRLCQWYLDFIGPLWAP